MCVLHRHKANEIFQGLATDREVQPVLSCFLQEFLKQRSKVFWMGPWALPELLAASTTMPKPVPGATVKRLFERYAGVSNHKSVRIAGQIA